MSNPRFGEINLKNLRKYAYATTDSIFGVSLERNNMSLERTTRLRKILTGIQTRRNSEAGRQTQKTSYGDFSSSQKGYRRLLKPRAQMLLGTQALPKRNLYLDRHSLTQMVSGC